MIQTSLTTALAIGVLSVTAMPTIAQAKPSFQLAQFNAPDAPDAPQINSFTANQVDSLTPGTELTFTLQGTPNSRATFAVGSVTNLPMQEVQPGVYEGRYTIRNQDQISNATPIRANLRQGNLIVSTQLQQPLFNSNTATAPNRPPQSQSLTVDRFSVQPIADLQPGSVLNFTLVGTPNARATFSIDGVAYNQPMQESSSGTYQGQYVIRRQDDFSNSTTVTASLQSGSQVVRARLDQALAATTANPTANPTSPASPTQLPLEVLSPANNSRVSGTIELRGRSAPNTTVNVEVRATTSLAGLVGIDRNIVSRAVQTDAQGNFSLAFQPGITVPGTRYEVNLRATSGNQNREQTLVLIQR